MFFFKKKTQLRLRKKNQLITKEQKYEISRYIGREYLKFKFKEYLKIKVQYLKIKNMYNLKNIPTCMKKEHFSRRKDTFCLK